MRMYQIKSSWYYVFWGAMAVAVVGGQIYIGSGYREMANEIRIFRSQCVMEVVNSESK